jgi:hypothetical protein
MVKILNSKFSPNKSMFGVATKGLLSSILLFDPVTKIRSKEELQEVRKVSGLLAKNTKPIRDKNIFGEDAAYVHSKPL